MTKVQVRPEGLGEVFEWQVPVSGYCVASPNPDKEVKYWGNGLFRDRVWQSQARDLEGED